MSVYQEVAKTVLIKCATHPYKGKLWNLRSGVKIRIGEVTIAYMEPSRSELGVDWMPGIAT